MTDHEITPQVAAEIAVHEMIEVVDRLGEYAEFLSPELGDLIYASTKLDKLVKQAWGAA